MKKEELVELGLDDEQIKGVFKLNGIAVENVRTQMTEVEQERDSLKTEKEALEAQLAEGGVNQEDLESLKQAKEDLEAQLAAKDQEIEAARNEGQEKLDQFTYESLLEKALVDAGAKSLKMAKAVLNLDEVKLVDGKLEGIDEELERVTKDDEFKHNFGVDQEDTSKLKLTQGRKGNKERIVTKDLADMTYSERVELKRNDPTAYEQLAGK